MRLHREQRHFVGAGLALLEFGDHPAEGGVHDAVEIGIADPDRNHGRRDFRFARSEVIDQQFERRRRQVERGIGRAEFGCEAEHGRGVGAPAFQRTVDGEKEEGAMGLDRAGEVDRLVGAVQQVDLTAVLHGNHGSTLQFATIPFSSIPAKCRSSAFYI